MGYKIYVAAPYNPTPTQWETVEDCRARLAQWADDLSEEEWTGIVDRGAPATDEILDPIVSFAFVKSGLIERLNTGLAQHLNGERIRTCDARAVVSALVSELRSGDGEYVSRVELTRKACESALKHLFFRANVSIADRVGRILAADGHFPFVPHKAMEGWEAGSFGTKLGRDRVIEMCLKWVRECDYLMLVGQQPELHSDGVRREKKEAEGAGIPVLRCQDPDHPPEIEGISQATLASKQVEYEVCAESYRHTYQTIWQAGAVLLAASAAVLAFAAKSPETPDWLIWFSGVPILFWFYGIYLPMDRLGHHRWLLLKRMEKGMGLSHFRNLEETRFLFLKVYTWVSLLGAAVTCLYAWGLTAHSERIVSWLFRKVSQEIGAGLVAMATAVLMLLTLVLIAVNNRDLEAGNTVGTLPRVFWKWTQDVRKWLRNKITGRRN